MLLPREFVTYIGRRIMQRLVPGMIDTAVPQRVAEISADMFLQELTAEDRLNDEVRAILDDYADYMRKEGVSYQEMFRRSKNTLIAQRKMVRASGRDTGDAMKLSRDKVTDISHKLVAALKKSRELRLKRDVNEIRLEIIKVVTEILSSEEKVDRAARDKVRSIKRDIPEGSEEWDLLHQRYYTEELKKLGIDFAR
ncbi:DUF507 family protein [Nevskia soli]|uniref:DUF507 family protein n=1 Tax=Nevskia soli TaxID=418856 RepID=UPI0015D92E15|nr:DUF507 family protein [Nevskia soli]